MDTPAWRSWTKDDVSAWLRSLELDRCVQVFRDNEIAGDVLAELTLEVLRDEIGVKAFGDRVRITNGVKALIGADASSASASTPAASVAPATTGAPLPAAGPAISVNTNALDLVVLHAAPLVIKDSKGRIYPMEKLDLEAERRAITTALLTDVRHKAIAVRFEIATADILRSLMTTCRCRVLHFSGHGLGQRAAVCFEDGVGCTHLITPELLRQLTFSGMPTPTRGNAGAGSAPTLATASGTDVQLVFVNACHSEKVASVFLNAGIPHVVAVHSDSLVVDASATMFAKHFYLSLFSGHTVATAFTIAKGAVRALPTQRRAACCCAHLHEPTCPWVRLGSRHSHHNPDKCCCKGASLAFPHDESSKFLLLGSGSSAAASAGGSPHEVALFGDIPTGALSDHTPKCRSSIPSMHGQFIGRNSETYLLVRSIKDNAVTVCLGAPGIGKSSLAISVAHFVHNRRMLADGVFYVDLEGQKLSTVRYAIAQSMGMPAADTDEECFAELEPKSFLLVLDKVEELLDEDKIKAGELLGRLISVAPNARLLLASRRNLHIPNVTSYSLSISELPLHTATELLCLAAPGCSPRHAERLARICGCLPLAIRVVGRALANARMTVTPERMIEYLESDERRFETIRDLNQAGHKECVDRCIRSSFCHLDEPLRLAFMALGFFRGSFDVNAAHAVLLSAYSSDSSTPGSAATSTTFNSSLFPDDAYANRRNQRLQQASRRTSGLLSGSSSGNSNSLGGGNRRDDDATSVHSLGSQLSNMDEFGFDNDGAMTNDSYDLLDLESPEEVRARAVRVPSAKAALEQLHQWSLVEFDSKTNRYRMHNLVQLFAEEEAARMGEGEPASSSAVSPTSSFVSATASTDEQAPPPAATSSPPVPLGRELALTWKRRFVRHYCMIVARASHAYRFEGTLALFDKERPNIESAMRLAQELTTQSIEQVREANRQYQQEVEAAAMTSTSLGTPHSFRTSRSHPQLGQQISTSSSSSSLSSISSSSATTASLRSLARDSAIVDALLYSNLVVRSRFIFRARIEPRRRIQIVSACLQLSRETRALTCACGNSENDPSRLLWEDAKYDRDLASLDDLPSFEEPAEEGTPGPSSNDDSASKCTCVGIRELIALEALLLTDLGYACCDVTDWIAGEFHYLESLRLQREVLGWAEHPQVAEVLNQFGICLSTRWGYLSYNVWLLKHAERLLRGSLMMRKRVLGDNHPEYATSLNNLANFYKNCHPNGGRHGSVSSSGTSSTLGSLSSGSNSQRGQHQKPAHQHHRHRRRDSDQNSSTGSDSISSSSTSATVVVAAVTADEVESIKSGSSSSTTVAATVAATVTVAATTTTTTVTKTSVTLSSSEQQTDIESMYRLSLKIREANLGRGHPQVAQSLNNLALFLSNQLESKHLSEEELAQRRGEIEKLYERALAIRRSTLGNASFETAATLNNMGNFKRLSKDFRGAEENIKEALQITNRYFNDISPRAARIYINLARVYKDQQRYDDAVAAYSKAKEIRQKLFPDTRDVGYCVEQIGKCMRLQGKEEEGRALEEEGRRMKKVGLSVVELEPASPGSASAAVLTNGSSTFTPGAHTTTGHLVARVDVYDTVEREALVAPKFNFPGKLLGERGIHLKKIEAIACAQLRYFGPWPNSFRNRDAASSNSSSSSTGRRRETQDQAAREEAYVQVTSTSEQSLERAKLLCVELLRSVKVRWERYVGGGGGNNHPGPGRRPASGGGAPNGNNSATATSEHHQLPPGRRPTRGRGRHLHQTRHLHQQPAPGSLRQPR